MPPLLASIVGVLGLAVLLLAVAGLLALAKSVADLRAEVRSLRDRIANPPPAPLPPPPLPPPPAPAPVAVQAPAPPSEIPADVMTAILCAVYAVLGEEHRIISVTPVESLMWSREGRRSIFDSHSFR